MHLAFWEILSKVRTNDFNWLSHYEDFFDLFFLFYSDSRNKNILLYFVFK